MAYDHPAYRVPALGGGATTAGNGTVSARFCAFTAMIAKSAQVTAAVAGTSAGHTIQISKVSGTATTSLAVTTLGTGAVGTTTNLLLGSTALAQGDQLICSNGTDATGVAVVAYELLVNPGADVTV